MHLSGRRARRQSAGKLRLARRNLRQKSGIALEKMHRKEAAREYFCLHHLGWLAAVHPPTPTATEPCSQHKPGGVGGGREASSHEHLLMCGLFCFPFAPPPLSATFAERAARERDARAADANSMQKEHKFYRIRQQNVQKLETCVLEK